MGRFDGKVVFITGAARGQGRSHAIRFAEEGADVIAVDLCEQIPSVPYPLATPEDLDETVAEVEKLDRRIVARRADVRDRAALEHVVAEGVADLSRLDFVLANAGIGIISPRVPDPVAAFTDTIDINLTGVWHTIHAALPVLLRQCDGGSIVITSSVAGLKEISGPTPGGEAYTAAKHALVGLMRSFAKNYAANGIRVNSVHPTGVDTPMIMNEVTQSLFEDAPGMIDSLQNLLPVDVVQPIDISHAIAFLCSDDARYITGVALPVDAGILIK